MKKVLLIFPGGPQVKPSAPFSVIVLASYLRKKGIPVEVLDTRVSTFKDRDYNNYMLVGISSKTGEQLASSIEVCNHIRQKSKVPIVFGGPHATFFPEQTCKSGLVDFVVKGEGEETLYELIKALQENSGFAGIAGLTFKSEGRVISNNDRGFIDMETLDPPAYDLIDLGKYQDSFQSFTLETSRGCPYRCEFCYVHDFHKRKWRTKGIQQSVGEIKEMAERYHVRNFYICDDNFFVNKRRVIEFSKELMRHNLDVEIQAYARANYFSEYSDEELGLLKKSGFKFIAIGAESGSQRVLDLIKKDIKREDILDSAKNCISHGLTPVFSFVIGTPGEKRSDLNKTIDMFFELKKISPKIEINGFYIFTPYPGTPIYAEAIRRGYVPSDSLEGWASWNFSDLSNLSWLSDNYRTRLQVLSKIVLFWFLKDRLNSYGVKFKRNKLGTWYNNLIWSFGEKVLFLDAYLRLKSRFFSFGYEWILFGKIALKFKVT